MTDGGGQGSERRERSRRGGPGRRAALHLRVSTARQAEHDLSIPDQRRQGEAWCQANGATVARVYEEHGASASDDRREAFRRMLDDAHGQPRPFDLVVVHSFSRFFRDAYLGEFYVRRLRRLGVEVVSITRPVEPDPTGELVPRILQLFDERSSRENAKHARRVLLENARQGHWNGSVPPFGCRAVDAGRRGDKVKRRLAPLEAEAEVVRPAFALQRAGRGFKAIARELNEADVRHRRGRPFSTGFVHGILTNRAYRGEHVDGRLDSRTGLVRPEAEWVAVPVPPIVDPAEFDRAQLGLSRRDPRRVPPRITSAGPTLLSRVARCAACGGAMQLMAGKGGRFRYYACSGRRRMGPARCAGRNVRADRLVVGSLRDGILGVQGLGALADAARRDEERAGAERAGAVEAARLRLEDAEGRLGRPYGPVEAGGAAPDELLARRVAELRQARSDATAEPDAARSAPRGDGLAARAPAAVNRFVGHARAILGGEDRRAAVRRYIGRVVVDPPTVTTSGSYEPIFADPLTRGGVPGPMVPILVRRWRARQDSNL